MGKLILNGVEYSTSGNLYNPVIYSDTERVIGVWRDNKPLYQKTIDISPLPNNTTKEIQLDADIERVISMCGYGIDSNDKWDVFFNDVVPTNVTGSIRVFANTVTKKLYINTGENLTSYTEAYVTIQYTKTTDTAGSGNWNTDGIPTHHYSTNEQVVGTWYDGSTIYEKTFILGTSWDFTANTWAKSEINKGNMNIIVDGTIYVFYDGSPSCHKVQLGWIDNKLAGNCFRNFEAAAGSAVVLRYTKSS